MPEETSLKRNTDDEVLPQGYSTELSDWKEVIVDDEGKQYVRDTEVLAKLTEMDNKLQTLENTVDEDGNQKVTQYGNNGLDFVHIVEEITTTGGEDDINVIDIQEPLIVDTFEWWTDSKFSGWPMFKFYDKNGEAITTSLILNSDGTGTTGATADSIQEDSPQTIQILEFDEDNGNYKFALDTKYISETVNGFTVDFRNNTTDTEINFNCLLTGRKTK